MTADLGPAVDGPRTVHRKILDDILAGSNDYAPYLRAIDTPAITDWDENGVDAEWIVKETTHHSGGAVFGGYTALLADRFAGLAVFPRMSNGETFRTADLRVTFVRPITAGSVSIRGEIVSKSSHVAHTRVEFRADDGSVLATAEATQIIVPFRRPAPTLGTTDDERTEDVG